MGLDPAAIPESAFRSNWPEPDSEYLEWIALLQTVVDSGPSYTMLELGAGYGRWGVRAALAAKMLGKRPQIVFVEGEPSHAQWLRDAVVLNEIEHCSIVHEAALAYEGKPVGFSVQFGDYTPDQWYGQGTWSDDGAKPPQEEYCGRTVFRTGGVGMIYVPAMTLEQIADGIERIDLLNADLQGAERSMVERSMDVMNAKVRRAFISTHALDIDELCETAFAANGWHKVNGYPCFSECDTPYGRITFNDGVQDWINPRLD
jgi:FkbM family methyltransferase